MISSTINLRTLLDAGLIQKKRLHLNPTISSQLSTYLKDLFLEIKAKLSLFVVLGSIAYSTMTVTWDPKNRALTRWPQPVADGVGLKRNDKDVSWGCETPESAWLISSVNSVSMSRPAASYERASRYLSVTGLSFCAATS